MAILEKYNALKKLDQKDLKKNQIDKGKHDDGHNARDDFKELKDEKASSPNNCFIEILLITAIDISQGFDFVSDLLIILALSRSNDTWWFFLSSFLVLAPYLTIYTSLLNNLIGIISEKISKFNYT